MKNFIKTNYNIYPKKIYKKDNIYFFFSSNEKIVIVKTDKDKNYLSNLANISNELYRNGIMVHTFLLNINGEYYTKNENEYIVLLKINNNSNVVTLKDINKYDINNSFNLEKIDIVNEMEKKIDTLEKEMTDYNKEYPIIQESINYFIGLSENAIQMIKTINIYNNSIIHIISLDKYNSYEFNNPFNLKLGNKMYDYALYFKNKFYNEYINYDELFKVIKSNSKEDLICFYCFMLYQKEYFDCVKEILLNRIEEKSIYKYINKIKEYKELLKYIKDNLQNINEIMELEWIDK